MSSLTSVVQVARGVANKSKHSSPRHKENQRQNRRNCKDIGRERVKQCDIIDIRDSDGDGDGDGGGRKLIDHPIYNGKVTQGLDTETSEISAGKGDGDGQAHLNDATAASTHYDGDGDDDGLGDGLLCCVGHSCESCTLFDVMAMSPYPLERRQRQEPITIVRDLSLSSPEFQAVQNTLIRHTVFTYSNVFRE